MTSHASMNRIYRLVFNAATGMYVAVAETAKGSGKAGRSASAAMLAALTAVGGASGLSAAGAQGLPTGGVAVTNNVSFSQTSNTLTMNQTGNAAIVNWNGFSIAAGNSVNINQQSASSVMLNRVVGNSMSEIYGSINAIGKVMLVNQNGILMGAGSQVNTSGFLASTLNIKDSDFLAGKYIFDIANNTGGTAGSIINNGRINTPSGYAVLIAPQVTNNGFIAARQGKVAIGAGNKVSLDMVGDGLISLKVDQAALNAALVNTGTIEANGGTVLLKASSANALFDTVINSTGIIRADSIANVNGRIILDGGAKGITEVTSEITARGLNAGETGGQISVLGDRVGLLGSGRLDASGDAGGGTVLVGGNWQGNGPERNASRTIVGRNASIDVSATGYGNGGTAVVWADGRTDMSGTIKATGGVNGGNGGHVETSGKAALDLQGRVDVTAHRGKGGQWLLDPNDININNATQEAIDITNPSALITNYQDDASADPAIVNAAALGAALTGGVTINVKTSNAGTAGGSGSIYLNSSVTAAGAGTLNLIANSDINLNAAIASNGTQALNVGLYAGSTGTPASIATAGGRAGDVFSNLAGSISTSGGDVVMVGGNANPVTLNGSITTAGGSVLIKSTGGAIYFDKAINAGTGTVRLLSDGQIYQGTGAITAASLGVRGTEIDLSTANNTVGMVALDATTNASALRFKNTTGFTVGTVAADAGGYFAAATGIKNVNQNITLSAGGAIVVNQAINAGTGTIRLESTAAITQAVAGVITASNLGARGTAVDLSGAANVVSGNVGINASAGNVLYKSTPGFALGSIAADGTLFGTATAGLSAVGNHVTIDSAGTVTQTTGNNVTAAGLELKGAGNFALNNAANTVTTLAGNGTGEKKFVNSAALTVGTVGATSGLTGAAGDVSLRAVTGDINITQNIDAGSGTTRLQADAGAVTRTAGVITAANLGVRAGTSVSLGGSNVIAAGGSFAASAAGGNVSFINTNGVKVDTLAADALSGMFTATNGLSAAGNNVVLSAGAGSFTQTSGMNINAVGLELNGAAAYALGSTGNTITNIAATTGAGAIGFTNSAALNVGTVGATTGITRAGDVSLRTVTGNVAVNQLINAGVGTVRLQADAGTVAQAAAGVVTAANLGARGTSVDLSTNSNAVSSDVAINASTGTAKFKNGAAFNVGSIAADGSAFTATTGVTTNNQDITLNAGGALAINQAVNAGTGTVRMQSTAAITQAVAGVITAANLGARGTAVDLSGAASVVSGNVGINASAGHALYKSASAFNLGSIAVDGTLFGTTTAGMAAVGNNVTVDSAGAVTQAAGSDVTASGLLVKGAGAFTLTNTTNSVATIAAETGAGTVKYVNAGALTVGTVGTTDGITRTGNVAVNTQTGNLNLTQNINTGINTNQVTLQALAGAVNQTAGVITTGALGAKSGVGDVDLGTSSNAVGSTVAFSSAGNVKFKNNGGYQIGAVVADAPVFTTALDGITGGAVGGNVLLDTSAGTVTQAAGKAITTLNRGLQLNGNAAYTLLDGSNNVGKLAATTGTGDISYRNAGAFEIGNVYSAGVTRTGNVTLQTVAALTQTEAVTAANLQLLGGQTTTLTNAGNNVASLSGTSTALSLINSGALALGALTVAGPVTLATGGTVSQTGALTQTGGGAVNITATAGSIKLTNVANDVSGSVNLSAAAGGVAFVNNNAAGIQVGNITAAASMNSTNPADIANFTASDAALTGVALLQARQGNIERSGSTKIVADRAVLVAANRIGGATANDATLGVRVEGAAGASARQVYLSAGATQMASTFGPASAPLFYKNLMNGAAPLPSPMTSSYNGVAVDFNAAATAAAAAAAEAAAAARRLANANSGTPAVTTLNQAQQAQRIAQNQPSGSPPFAFIERPNIGPNINQQRTGQSEPIGIPSCTPGAPTPADAGQC